jgi:hypothetical protein
MNKIILSTMSVVAVVALLVSGFAWAGTSSGATVKPAPQVLSWRFESDLTPAFSVGDSVLLEPSRRTPGEALINGDTDRLTKLSPPTECEPAGANLTQILYDCSVQGDEAAYLFSPASGTTAAINPEPLHQTCSGLGISSCTPVTVGTYWIEWDVAEGCQDDRCDNDYVYQNIATGQIVQGLNDGGGGQTWDNPNTPALVHSICSPLRAPAQSNGGGAGDFEQATVQFFGRYALLDQDPAVDQEPAPSTELAECGSSFHTQLQPDLDEPAATGGDNYIVWIASPRVISYVDLANRRRGNWTVPAEVGTLQNAVVAGRRLFVEGNDSTWSAKLPKQG